MNILPKKRWHVRTKENIARVRRDEAEAAKLEKEIQRRSKLAEQEARTAYLRQRARGDQLEDEEEDTEEIKKPDTHASIFNNKGNINFFQDIEEGKKLEGTNKEHEQEKKEEQEKYEKDIGLLTYLGQNSLELQGSQAWYADKNRSVSHLSGEEELDLKIKNKLDPIKDIIKHAGLKLYKSQSKNKSNLNTTDASATTHKEIDFNKSKKSHKKKHKKHHKEKNKSHKSKGKKRKHSSDSESDNRSKKSKRSKASKRESSDSTTDSEDEDNEKNRMLQKMREERLKREQIERKRVEKLLSGKSSDDKDIVNPPVTNQKYNNQFNPLLARQNKLQSGVKYWMQ